MYLHSYYNKDSFKEPTNILTLGLEEIEIEKIFEISKDKVGRESLQDIKNNLKQGQFYKLSGTIKIEVFK